MKKFYFLTLIIVCILNSACSLTKNDKQAKELEVNQLSKIKDWDIKILPRYDHKKWVYDTKIKYLGERPANLSLINYDSTEITYNEVQPSQVLETFGSFDYKSSVYSRKNNNLIFKLKWSEGNKIFSDVAEFKVESKN
ncbi:hypothetical protein [Bacillus sp. OAE603]|uniref:hypothetical protein n=1 Tax=Gottfriedia sp. OAE603 TaxID=2663872 RepID=UPI001789A314